MQFASAAINGMAKAEHTELRRLKLCLAFEQVVPRGLLGLLGEVSRWYSVLLEGVFRVSRLVRSHPLLVLLQVVHVVVIAASLLTDILRAANCTRGGLLHLRNAMGIGSL